MQTMGMPVRVRDELSARLACEIVAYAAGVEPDGLWRGGGGRAAAGARHLAMYLTNVAFSISLARVGAAFGRNPSTIGYACRRVEELRDDPDFDAWVDAMERALREAPAPASAPDTACL